MKKIFGVFAIIGFVLFLVLKKEPPPNESVEITAETPDTIQPLEPQNTKQTAVGMQISDPPEAPIHQKPQIAVSASPDKDAEPGSILKYSLDEGLAVVNGDIVVGVPLTDNGQDSGYVRAPELRLWPQRDIPYHIQPSVKNPERVEQALALFSQTTIRFVPYTNQEDVLVFEDSAGACKSYIGKIGGKQPIWIPLGCEAREIAHELMHALGFIHEQNRIDRDQFIEVLADNIEPEFKENFDKFSNSLMRLTGLAPFDFESLMIYPVSMFAKSGQSTMRPKNNLEQIRPGPTLSPRDIERINRGYPVPNPEAPHPNSL